MKTALIVLAVVVLAAAVILADGRRKRRKVESAFQGRTPMSAEHFHEFFFMAQGIPFAVAAGVRQILEEHLGADLSRLQAADDFSTNLGFFWDFDSLANVEIICALEERFGITITDEEAEAAHTVADIVLLVNRKIVDAAA